MAITIGYLCGLVLVLGLIQTNLVMGHTLHMVGDETGWTDGVDFKAWAQGRRFVKGDSLVFRFKEGDGVQEVNAQEFETCETNHPISEGHQRVDTIPLERSGPHYFIADQADLCRMGVKLAIEVACATQNHQVQNHHGGAQHVQNPHHAGNPHHGGGNQAARHQTEGH